MTKMLLLTFFVLFVSLGCSTVAVRGSDYKASHKKYKVYPALNTSVRKELHPSVFRGVNTVRFLMFTLDIGISAITDTILLPYDIYRINTK